MTAPVSVHTAFCHRHRLVQVLASKWKSMGMGGGGASLRSHNTPAPRLRAPNRPKLFHSLGGTASHYRRFSIVWSRNSGAVPPIRSQTYQPKGWQLAESQPRPACDHCVPSLLRLQSLNTAAWAALATLYSMHLPELSVRWCGGWRLRQSSWTPWPRNLGLAGDHEGFKSGSSKLPFSKRLRPPR